MSFVKGISLCAQTAEFYFESYPADLECRDEGKAHCVDILRYDNQGHTLGVVLAVLVDNCGQMYF
jgi:hypothetical protein